MIENRFSGRKSQRQQKLAKKITQGHSRNTATNMFLVNVKKNICTAVLLDPPNNCILEALGNQVSVYSCKSPLENVCSRDVGSFYLVKAE